mgnify:CR=1 FL=1
MLVKTDKEACGACISACTGIVALAAALLLPFMPSFTTKALGQLGLSEVRDGSIPFIHCGVCIGVGGAPASQLATPVEPRQQARDPEESWSVHGPVLQLSVGCKGLWSVMRLQVGCGGWAGGPPVRQSAYVYMYTVKIYPISVFVLIVRRLLCQVHRVWSCRRCR